MNESGNICTRSCESDESARKKNFGCNTEHQLHKSATLWQMTVSCRTPVHKSAWTCSPMTHSSLPYFSYHLNPNLDPYQIIIMTHSPSPWTLILIGSSDRPIGQLHKLDSSLLSMLHTSLTHSPLPWWWILTDPYLILDGLHTSLTHTLTDPLWIMTHSLHYLLIRSTHDSSPYCTHPWPCHIDTWLSCI